MPPLQKTKKDKGLDAGDLYLEWQDDYPLAVYHLFNKTLTVSQRAMFRLLKDASFFMIIASRGMGKSFALALIACLNAILNPNTRVGIIAPSYRQAKMIFDKILQLWLDAPLFANECEKRPVFGMDMCYVPFKNGSVIQAIPLGSGDTIRGSRFQHLIVDEWIHVPNDIMSEVILPMLNVSADPIGQIERWERAMSRYSRGDKDPFSNEVPDKVNKIIMASTAYYKFHPSYEVYRNWVELSKVDNRYKVLVTNYLTCPIYAQCTKCNHLMNNYPIFSCSKCGAEENDLRYGGYMQMEQIHHQMRNVPASVFMCENLSIWTDDSGGFFRASHIMNCTPDFGQADCFFPHLEGIPGSQYVIGIDPGREGANFAITILEVSRYSARVVWCRGISKSEFTRADAYGEMADLIRSLKRKFNVVGIGMDAGGGGYAIRDLLVRPSSYIDGNGQMALEPPILQIMGENPTHDAISSGDRILHMINFQNKWINDSAQSLRRALEAREILFPTAPRGGSDIDEEKCKVLEDINALADELVSLKTEPLKRMSSYLKFEKSSESSLIDRAMSAIIAYYVAGVVREQLTVKDNTQRMVTGMAVNHREPQNPIALDHPSSPNHNQGAKVSKNVMSAMILDHSDRRR